MKNKNTITIDIYSDTICPWCYIGLNRIKSAIKNFSNFNFDLIWRPFQLNSDMPLEGMDRQKYLEIKFDGKENAKKIYKDIYKVGLLNDIHFQFEKIFLTPNSFASHKLLALAHISKKQTEVVETLFFAYFIEGRDIGSVKELIKIAKHHNIFDNNTNMYLRSNDDKESLLGEETHARSIGIKGVPCYIINKQFVLFGAQDEIKFINIFNRIKNDL